MLKPDIEDIKRAISKHEKIPQDSINVIETHISRVFVTASFVYKQKKPVDFGFIDYTSLEKRKFFARKELSLNRRACSGVYIDLAELRKKKESLFIGFKGGALKDVLVRMRRVKETNFLTSILNSFDFSGKNSSGQGLSVRDITAPVQPHKPDKLKVLKLVAKRIYLFHKNAKSSKRLNGFGKIDVYKENWDDNFLSIEKLIENYKGGVQGQELSPAGKGEIFRALNVIEEFYNRFLQSEPFGRFVKLRLDGCFIRDLHGDLRMEHIAVTGKGTVKKVCIMDCVEFNERFRNQDIYLDIAFLLMDFEFNGFFYESVKFFNYYKGLFNYKKYIADSEQYESSVIPFFKAYRSIVRTKINLLSGRLEDALKHLNLALFYILSLKKPPVILNIGLSGSGKSSLSDLLADCFYSKNIKSDRLRSELFAVRDKIFKYSGRASEEVYNALLREGINALDEGKSVIFDATFMKKSHREKIINHFKDKECNFIILYSKIFEDKESVIVKRLEKRTEDSRVNDAAHRKQEDSGGGAVEYSEADISVYLKQKTAFEEPEVKEFYNTDPLSPNNIIFITVDASLEVDERFNYAMSEIIKGLSISF